MDMMDLHISLPNKEELTVSVAPEDSVFSLRIQIADKLGLPVERIKLTEYLEEQAIGGEPDDNDTIDGAAIDETSNLFVTITD